jgi:UDP-glucuronate 4-epimerase
VSSERFLVTGALGCIGAWTCRLLVEEGVPVVGYDLGSDPHRLRLIMSPEQLVQVTLVPGDVTDLDQLLAVLGEHEISNVVHLAGLQLPFCKADPPLGARVNVVGTVNVFEAAKRHALKTAAIAYASTSAVYDQAGAINPQSHYGVYKVANEGTARVYWQDDGIPSIGLRPFCVYGPGRDQGVTSTPTVAMLAAARGEPYRISFGGRTQLHYAPDVARAFVAATRSKREGAEVFNVGGPAVHMREVVAAIEAAAPEAAGTIAFEDVPRPFPEELHAGGLEVELTPLAQGVRETVDHFRHHPREET